MRGRAGSLANSPRAARASARAQRSARASFCSAEARYRSTRPERSPGARAAKARTTASVGGLVIDQEPHGPGADVLVLVVELLEQPGLAMSRR